MTTFTDEPLAHGVRKRATYRTSEPMAARCNCRLNQTCAAIRKSLKSNRTPS